MNKIVLLLFLTLFLSATVSGKDEKYLENVRLEPEHGHMNAQGEVDILFNLPEHDLVKKAYLSVRIGITDITMISTTVEGSKLGYLNNKIILKGSELHSILQNTLALLPLSQMKREDVEKETEDDSPDTETNDDDTEEETEDPGIPAVYKDGTYNFQLIVELEQQKETEKEEDPFDDEKDDDDKTPSTTPANVSSPFSITFDNKPPAAPKTIESEGGDKRIVLYITPPVKEAGKEDYEKIGKYHISLDGLFLRNGEEVEASLSYVSTVQSDSYDKVWKVSLSGKEGLELINNDDNLEKYIYSAKVSAEDIAGNHDPENWIALNASAFTTYGFWSHYKAEGGKEEGGFCFIASAGFGSYNSNYVMILRNFRDIRLQNFSLGRSLIKHYYSLGHYPGHFIERHPVTRPVVKAILFPFVIAAWFFTDAVGLVILFLWFTLLFSVFLKGISFKTTFLAIIFLLAAMPSNLEALGGEFSFTNSLYYPSNIDKDIDSKPFKTIGGSKQRYLPSLTFGLQVPLLEEYIRWSVVAGTGFTRFKGTAVKADGEKSLDSTRMYFIPLTGEIKLRPAYSFPVWPYASIGLDYVIWWIREKGKTAQEGGTFGFHGSFGILVSLNWLDRGAAQKLQHSSGIKNSALFAHYRLEKVDDFGKEKSFDLSHSRFEFGILFEF